MRVIQRRFSGFDGTEKILGRMARPDRYRHLFEALSRPATVIPRGAGLSYACASAGAGVVSVSSRSFNRVLAFDQITGSVRVEPGLTCGALLDISVANGWYPPVLPGHPAITVGGCIGFDIHGKSGRCFRSCVRELSVFNPSLGEVLCAPDREPELFELTIGGFGMTGFVTSATLQLIPLAGNSLERRRLPTADLLQTLEVLTADDSSDFIYSWNDLSLRGLGFGRGVVYAESFAETSQPVSCRYSELHAAPTGALSIPLLNRRTIGPANRIYRLVEGRRGTARLDLRAGTFPILGREAYFTALRGVAGFREYQMLVPASRFPIVAEGLEAAIRDSSCRPSLGSLKLLTAPPALLRFSGTGVAIALDVPADDAADRLFAHLDALVIRVGGLVNLSKDSRLSGDVVRELFNDFDAFRSGIRALGDGGRMQSELRRRILG